MSPVHAVEAYGRIEVLIHLFFTSFEANCQLHDPATLTRGKTLLCLFDSMLGGP